MNGASSGATRIFVSRFLSLLAGTGVRKAPLNKGAVNYTPREQVITRVKSSFYLQDRGSCMKKSPVTEVMDCSRAAEVYLFECDIVIPEFLLQVIRLFTGIEAEYFYGVHGIPGWLVPGMYFWHFIYYLYGQARKSYTCPMTPVLSGPAPCDTLMKW
jgi:hypothetical protein